MTVGMVIKALTQGNVNMCTQNKTNIGICINAFQMAHMLILNIRSCTDSYVSHITILNYGRSEVSSPTDDGERLVTLFSSMIS